MQHLRAEPPEAFQPPAAPSLQAALDGFGIGYVLEIQAQPYIDSGALGVVPGERSPHCVTAPEGQAAPDVLSGQRNPGKRAQFSDQRVLKGNIGHLAGRLLLSKVMPIAATYQRSRVVAAG